MELGNMRLPNKGRSLRPVRNRRYNRRIFDGRPTKRLFTPEIKKYLKDWLIRRRENPYPSRDEKKSLAIETGLTYIQVCNWFANWRRKLKNAGREPQRKTWSHLIKTYNTQAKGNVEHFSICSDDSIWEEFDSTTQIETPIKLDHCYTAPKAVLDTPKYKNCIMEKYLRDIDSNFDQPTKLFTKWLESAANFQPRHQNYIEWETPTSIFNKKNIKNDLRREELDAAEALTSLANSKILM